MVNSYLKWFLQLRHLPQQTISLMYICSLIFRRRKRWRHDTFLTRSVPMPSCFLWASVASKKSKGDESQERAKCNHLLCSRWDFHALCSALIVIPVRLIPVKVLRWMKVKMTNWQLKKWRTLQHTKHFCQGKAAAHIAIQHNNVILDIVRHPHEFETVMNNVDGRQAG